MPQAQCRSPFHHVKAMLRGIVAGRLKGRGAALFYFCLKNLITPFIMSCATEHASTKKFANQ
jgi:tetrahydromethanopterin S-methyltransferase subunit D